ncbi:MAG: phosphotransferase, partial [Lachnospiraceae bacterium]|nr:phosphotransferase [Lachnospiraceae bacterium]
FALKEYHGQEKTAAYLHQRGAFLTEHRITCDYMLKNKEDALITEGVDGTKYTFHRWVKGRECDVKSRMDMVMAVSFLAGFHAACEGEVLRGDFCDGGGCEDRELNAAERKEGQPGRDAEQQLWLECSLETAYEKYRRRDRELRKIKKYIVSRKNKSDFELLYLRCFPEYIRQSEKVLRFLDEHEGIFANHTMGVCHGDFNQHNVVMESGGMTLVHMEHAGYDAQVSDLSNFLRKCLEKHEWSETLGLEMLREYSRVHSLNDADWVELYGRMSYPEKFWKIANRYYYSNKVLDSGRDCEKLKKELCQNEARKNFLAVLKRARL